MRVHTKIAAVCTESPVCRTRACRWIFAVVTVCTVEQLKPVSLSGVCCDPTTQVQDTPPSQGVIDDDVPATDANKSNKGTPVEPLDPLNKLQQEQTLVQTGDK
eukprot:363970-Ditylum_brightwellii.AAC.1